MTHGIAGYAHVNICVDDLETAREFYENKLGLKVLPRPDFGGMGGYWFALGASQLHLQGVAKMPDWNDGAPHLGLYIAGDDFERVIGAIHDAGVEFTFEIREREDFGVPVRTAFVRDPAGNLIEFTDVEPLA
jgi:catechol 2,3-dioxygenase-like lactoylglutathione lyase family enzyme